jgi:alpha-L-fucosidase
MIRIQLAAAVPFFLFVSACKQAPAASVSDGNAPLASPGKEQDERMAWWRDARFGMFIHWGLYAIPAGEWPPPVDGKSAPNAN